MLVRLKKRLQSESRERRAPPASPRRRSRALASRRVDTDATPTRISKQAAMFHSTVFYSRSFILRVMLQVRLRMGKGRPCARGWKRFMVPVPSAYTSLT